VSGVAGSRKFCIEVERTLVSVDVYTVIAESEADAELKGSRAGRDG
jgi:hypothetical protein